MLSTPRRRLLLGLLFAVAFGLRAYHLADFPERNRTADEYAWTWSGMTLIGDGVPRAWSWLDGYRESTVTRWRGGSYRLVRPWLDHPPLYSLYQGAWMRLGGARDPFDVPLGTMRAATLALFPFTFFLFYAVAARLGGARLALLGLAFYATAPPAVLDGRLVMAEQLMLPLGLAGLYASLRQRQAAAAGGDGRGWLVVLGAVAAALPLTKVAALALVLYLFSLAVLQRSKARALAVCAGAAVGLAIYAAYGWHFGWPLFTAVLHAQAQRFVNFGGFYALVYVPRIVERHILYTPYLLAFGVLVADLRDGRHVELALMAVSYALGLAFFLAWNEYGWYAIPLHPLLAFGLASFVERALADGRRESLWIWLLFSGTYVFGSLCDARAGTPALWRWCFLALALALPFVVAARRPSRRGLGLTLGAAVLAQWLADAWYVVRQ